jgi:hypothetical protein
LNPWTTIRTFDHPIDVAVICARLESEGIACFLTNELTTQVSPYYSNAIGGVELQVRENDVENAIAILKEAGYYSDPETVSEAHLPDLLLRFQRITDQVPFLKHFPLLFRLMILLIVAIAVSVSIFVWVTTPTIYERLTANNWCLEYVTYKGENYLPQTTNSISIFGNGICQEAIILRKNGLVTLPGFQTKTIRGSWMLEDNLLQISRTDTFDFLYEEIYQVEFTDAGLELFSEKTTLHCHAENFHLNYP